MRTADTETAVPAKAKIVGKLPWPKTPRRTSQAVRAALDAAASPRRCCDLGKEF